MTGPGPTSGGNRLERALAALLATPPTTRADRDALLQRHPDLAELLAPMLDGAPADPRAESAVERVLGDYRLVRELGRGGMGIVYEAWQRSLDRRVAVKVLAPALVANPAAVARFHREATSAGRLRHPNLVEVYGFGSADGEHFFAMQFVDGAPLHDLAARFREPPAAVGLCEQLADALANVHAAGLVHRDVKPGNVLVRADGRALLTDFGVARDDSLPTLTREGGFLGTLLYASPEQVRGEVVDARGDVWAVGVILHELLTGEAPFAAPTEAATMQRILAEEPPRLQGRAGISDDLAAVVDRALAKNPAHRYASAMALLQDLRALRAGEPVTARLPTRIERLRRWARREPWRAVAAGVLALGVPALTGVVGYLLANAPRIEAAAAAEVRLEHEERLGTALASAHDGEERIGLAMLGPERPDEDLDTLVVRAMLHQGLDEPSAAQRLLRGRTEPVVALVLAFSAPRAARVEPVESTPNDPLECFVLGELMRTRRTFIGGGTRTNAKRILDLAARAVALSPTPRLSYLLNWVYAADDSGDRAAMDTAQLALAQSFPRSDVARNARARVLARFRPEQALALVDELDARHGASARTCITRGLAHEFMGRIEDSIAANRLACELEPRNTRAWSNLGVVLRKAKRTEESLAALERAVALEPRKANHWNLVGLSRRDAGDSSGAAEAFAAALEINPSYAAAAHNFGNLLARARDWPGALEKLSRAAQLDPNNLSVIGNLADVLANLGRHEEALPYAMQAVHLAPNDLRPHTNLATFALALNLPRLALQSAQRAAELGPESARSHLLVAQAFLAQAPPNAAAALTAARTADEAASGDDLAARLLIARALASVGDAAAAIAHLEATRTDPRFVSDNARRQIDAEIERLRVK